MGVPALALLSFGTRILTKVFPGKTKKAINQIVNTIVGKDADLQKALEQERKFILEYSKILPRVCLIMREAGRPFCLVVYTLTFVGYYLITGNPPHQLICDIAKWYAIGYLTSRGVEKVVQTLKG